LKFSNLLGDLCWAIPARPLFLNEAPFASSRLRVKKFLENARTVLYD
jgi:hypothetical protein